MSETLASADPRIAILKERLDGLRRELAWRRARTQWTTRLTCVIGLVAFLALSGYFYYGYREISQMTDPEQIVSVAQDLLAQNIPRAREALEQQITTAAPAWAEGLSKQAQASMPEARQKIEDYFV